MDENLTLAETDPQPAPLAPKHGLRWVFWGTEGIRAGWGVALFILLYLVFATAGGFLARNVLLTMRHARVLPVHLAFLMEAVQGVPALLATAIMALIEKRKFLSYGFQGQARAVRFFSGLFWGAFSLSVLILVLWKAHLLAFDGQALHGFPIVKYAVAWALLFLTVAIFEESMLRGYLQYTLTRGMGFWWSALLLSALFGFSHGTNPGESPVGLFGAAAVGLTFCLSLWYTGSLWWALGCHASWDWAQSYFYGTSDSGLVSAGHLFSEHPIGSRMWNGGTTGPEGSPFALMTVALMALVMWLWWRHKLVSPFREVAWRSARSRQSDVL